MNNKRITNYAAIINMSISQLVAFLDEVYCTGLNTGLYAARSENTVLSDALKLAEKKVLAIWH